MSLRPHKTANYESRRAAEQSLPWCLEGGGGRGGERGGGGGRGGLVRLAIIWGVRPPPPPPPSPTRESLPSFRGCRASRWPAGSAGGRYVTCRHMGVRPPPPPPPSPTRESLPSFRGCRASRWPAGSAGGRYVTCRHMGVRPPPPPSPLPHTGELPSFRGCRASRWPAGSAGGRYVTCRHMGVRPPPPSPLPHTGELTKFPRLSSKSLTCWLCRRPMCDLPSSRRTFLRSTPLSTAMATMNAARLYSSVDSRRSSSSSNRFFSAGPRDWYLEEVTRSSPRQPDEVPDVVASPAGVSGRFNVSGSEITMERPETFAGKATDDGDDGQGVHLCLIRQVYQSYTGLVWCF